MAATPRRENISGGSPYEPVVGYSRAVRVGAQLFVSGTTASSEGAPLPVDALAQAREALAIIRRVLEAAGSSLADVVRTRMFVVDISRNSEAVGRAHGEAFSKARPAASMVGVAALIDPAMLVEIEVDAIVGCGTEKGGVAMIVGFVRRRVRRGLGAGSALGEALIKEEGKGFYCFME